MQCMRDEMGKHLLVKTTAVIGPKVEMGDVQEAIHPDRLLRLHPPGAEASDGSSRPTLVTWRSLLSQMGLSNESKAVSSPGVRTTDEEDGKELVAESLLPIVDDADQQSQSRQVLATVRNELADGCSRTPRTCKPSNVWCEGKSEIFDRLKQTS